MLEKNPIISATTFHYTYLNLSCIFWTLFLAPLWKPLFTNEMFFFGADKAGRSGWITTSSCIEEASLDVRNHLEFQYPWRFNGKKWIQQSWFFQPMDGEVAWEKNIEFLRIGWKCLNGNVYQVVYDLEKIMFFFVGRKYIQWLFFLVNSTPSFRLKGVNSMHSSRYAWSSQHVGVIFHPHLFRLPKRKEVKQH